MLAAAERAIASVPGMLASRPDEIDDAAVREMILELNDRGRGNYLVAEQAGTVIGHAFLESLSLAATSHVVRLTIAVHEGHQRRGVGRALIEEGRKTRRLKIGSNEYLDDVYMALWVGP